MFKRIWIPGASAALALAQAAQAQTGPSLHVLFGPGVQAVPLGGAALWAALAVAVAAVWGWRGRPGRRTGAARLGLLAALGLAALALGIGPGHLPEVQAQAARVLALRTSPAQLPLLAGQDQSIELHNDTGAAITLTHIGIQNDAGGHYRLDASPRQCHSGQLLPAGGRCPLGISYTAHPNPNPGPGPGPAPVPPEGAPRSLSPLEQASALPRFVTQPSLSARAGQPWRYAVQATDAQGQPLAVELVAAESPSGAGISGAAGQQTVAWTPAAAGLHRIVLQATDAQGRRQQQSFALGVSDERQLPPDPATRASALPPDVVTPFGEGTRFLYTGAQPIQRGVAASAIAPERAAVLRGRATGADGQPLPGVRVSVHGHPEYGHTRTRADGWFDLAVNGGGWLTLHYQKPGYASAQRKLHAPRRDWAVADDVALIATDGQYARIELSGPGAQAPQLYWGNEMQDGRGKRRAAIYFPPGVQASAELPGGQQRPLTHLTVRVSEYTLGERGPQAMPAALPISVGYTWAANFTADEAELLGARHVRFDRPVYTYVSNFIGAPVGTAVPAGWYDFERAAWVGADNGRVIQILSTQGGQARLRVTEQERSATADELAALGITEQELRTLAQLYHEPR